MTIFDRFVELETPPAGDANTYAATDLDVGLRLGKGCDGRAAVLIVDYSALRPSVETKYLRAEFGIRCEITSDGQNSAEATCAVIECLSLDLIIVRHFLECITAAIATREPGADPANVVATLIDIFRAISRDARQTVQGLWGELFVVWQSSDPATVSAAWRGRSNDRHDFALGAERIEVKTSASQLRCHRFSHAQLLDAGESSLLVGSLLVEPAADGVTVRMLMRECMDRLPAGRHRSDLLERVASTLGGDWLLADRQKYSIRHSISTMRFFRAEKLPRLECVVHERVSDISYSVDLTGMQFLSQSDLAAHGPLGSAVCRRVGISAHE